MRFKLNKNSVAIGSLMDVFVSGRRRQAESSLIVGFVLRGHCVMRQLVKALLVETWAKTCSTASRDSVPELDDIRKPARRSNEKRIFEQTNFTLGRRWAYVK